MAGRLITERPKIMPAKAIEVRRKPNRSIGRGVRGSALGRNQLAARMPMMPIGTLIQKIQCQLRKVVRKPPTGGPVSGPISAGTDSQDVAATSWLRGVARSSTRRAIGVIIEPPMPCRNREPTKVSSECEKAQQIEPTMNTAMAARKTLVEPNRSAIQPEIGMKMASDTK